MSGRWMTPQILTPPTAYPVSLAEVKAQLGIATDVPDDDARLAGLIATATQGAEEFLGMALITRSYHGFMDSWPRRREGAHAHDEWPSAVGAGGGGGPGWHARRIEIPMPPLISVDAVTTYDDSDTPTVFDPANYFVDTTSTVGRLCLRDGQEWPCPTRTANGIEIGWTAGVGACLRPFIDETIRLGIIVAVGALNEQRGDMPSPDILPPAARALLGSRRLNWL